MRIVNLHVAGFGIWSGLRICGLGAGLNVLFGPNEAGKTTLLQFIRAMLYGFSPERRRYLPPLHGGSAGGVIEVETSQGCFQIARSYNPAATPDRPDLPVITAADGTRLGEHHLKHLLGEVDEAIFNNVFAVGLREIQELATLGDTAAAELLYGLAAGLDRVSLAEVLQELESLRNRLWDRQGGSSQVQALVAERKRLAAEIAALGAEGRRWLDLAAEQRQIDEQISRLEQRIRRLETQLATVELAAQLRERYARRETLTEALAALDNVGHLTPAAVARFEALQRRIAEHSRQMREQKAALARLREEANALTTDTRVLRHAPRIEALATQRPWLENLAAQIAQLEKETSELEAHIAVQREELGLSESVAATATADTSAQNTGKILRKLRGPWRAMRTAAQRVRQARQTENQALQTARSLAAQVQAALAVRQERELAGAIQRAGQQVAQLRRRIQCEQRIEQMTRYQHELEDQACSLVDRQGLPLWVIGAGGGVFGLGVLLVLAGVFWPGTVLSQLGWVLAVLGLAGSGGTAFANLMIERSSAQRLQTTERQLEMLRGQLRQAIGEREAMDRQLGGGGSLAARLEAAEKELAAFEELAPLDARRLAAQQDAESARRRLEQAKQELALARRRWAEALRAVGLPDTLAPRQIRATLERFDRLAQWQRALELHREELAQRRRERDTLADHVQQVAEEVGLAADTASPLETLRRLVEVCQQQQAGRARQKNIRQQARQVRRGLARGGELLRRLRHRRRLLLWEAGASDEEDLRRRAAHAVEAEALRRELATLESEIEAALAGKCSRQALEEHLAQHGEQGLANQREELLAQLARLQGELKARAERRGQLGEQLRTLAEDRALAAKQLELGVVERRLAEVSGHWRVITLAYRTLDAIRTDYQQTRQPEALQLASQLLCRLTGERYTRVWTPLGEQSLRVDDAAQRALPPEMLSSGAREQLFLALRLALARWYARRRRALPLVLDDVLVNFDAERVRAAAAVLREFAAEGQQILVFTCHEHIAELFAAQGVPVGRLPDAAASDPPPLMLSPSVVSVKARRPRRPTPRMPQRPIGIPLSEDELAPPVPVDRPPLSAGDMIAAAGNDVAATAAPPARSTPAPRQARPRRVFDADYFDGEEELERHIDAATQVGDDARTERPNTGEGGGFAGDSAAAA
jgi:uncharacterized protein YhaN